MPATKTARILLASQALAAGASVNTSEWNLSTAYGGLGFIKLTNGAAAPTTVPVIKFYAGESTGTKRLIHTSYGDTVNNSVTEVPFDFSHKIMFANITITNGATNGITVEAYGQELTTV